MKIEEKDLQGLLPNIRGLVDPKVEQRINEAFRRVYEFFILKFNEHEKAFNVQLSNLSIARQNELTGLIGAYTQPLTGSSSADPVLQSLIQQFGPQSANTIFAAPAGISGEPSFRTLLSSDIPGLDASKIISGTIALARLSTKVMLTDDAFTKVLGAPVADGYVLVKDNAGNAVKIITTA